MTLQLPLFILSFLLAGSTAWLSARFYRHTYSFTSWHCTSICIVAMILALIIGLFQFQHYPTAVYLEMIIVGPLTTLAFTDLKELELPDELNLIVFAFGLIYLLLTPFSLWEGLLSGGILFFSLFLIALLTGAMGGGDIKYALAIGIWFPLTHIIPFFYLSFLTACVYGIILLVFLHKKKNEPFAFGPFLIFATLVLFAFI